MSLVLGINAYHGDSAACILKEGRLVAAAEEERFRRIKHWAGFPSEAIRYCLGAAGARLGDLDCVAINRDPKANFLRKVRHMLSRRPYLPVLLDRVRNHRKWASVREELEKAFPGESLRCTIKHVEHHLAHLASAFLVSPFERAAVVSIDGMGDFSSACWGVGAGADIEVHGRIYFPHSLGTFYEALTQYLGFPNYGDEYKVMGLAAYGEPAFMNEMRRIVSLNSDGTFNLDLRFFRHDKENVNYNWRDCAPSIGRLYTGALEEMLGAARARDEAITKRHRDIAHSVQAIYEEAFFNLLNSLHRRCALDCVALAGGCAMNSVANGKIYSRTPFKRVFVQAAAGDAGGAVGAAFLAWRLLGNATRDFAMRHAYWGPEFSADDFARTIAANRAQLEAGRCCVQRVDNEDELCRRTVQTIAQGGVVGWFQGRMEWGPRALGNRSILCDPRRADMKEILNRKIKRRESFRPFAPSIPRDSVAEWFETDDDVPFMTSVFQIREERRKLIPAVTHVDGSGRLQTVERDANPLYWRLIKTFGARTGVPILLNTSFNENEPVVCRPEEALDCFLRTGMDVLVMGPYFIERHESEQGVPLEAGK
jgi:carbamoyltransferase